MAGTALQRFTAARPRLSGLVVTLMGLGFVGYNAWSIQANGVYYAKFFILGFPCALVGLWVIITGRTEPPRSLGLPPPPLWWRVVAIVLAVVGVGFGIYLSEMLRG